VSEQRWKARSAIVVAGRSIPAGATFSATREQVRHALAFGLVTTAPTNTRKGKSS
jgi:hypothetical protein